MASNIFRHAVAGKALRIEHSPSQMEFLDIFQSVGGKVWPASDLMVKYLSDTKISHGKQVLELGSGCGYVGIACAALGAKNVTLTDRTITQRRLVYDSEGMLTEMDMLPNRMLLDLCERNVLSNCNETENCLLNVLELEWGEGNNNHIQTILKNSNYDLIIGSDVTYHANLSDSLFWSVSELLRCLQNKRNVIHTGTDTNKLQLPIKFLASHQLRLDSGTELTLKTAKEYGLHCKTLAISTSTITSSTGSSKSKILRSGDFDDTIRRYTNADGVDGEYVLWQFTMPTI